MISSDSIISNILQSEGGFVNNSADLGGPTNFGITAETLAGYLGHPVTVDDVRNLDPMTAKEIYEKLYVEPFGQINDSNLLALMVDSAVQHGVSRVKSWIAAIQPGQDVYRELLKTRIIFYGNIVTNRPANAQFDKGWMTRLAQFIR